MTDEQLAQLERSNTINMVIGILTLVFIIQVSYSVHQIQYK